MPRSDLMLRLLLVLPLARAFLPVGRGTSRRSSAVKASFTFDDYLREVRLPAGHFDTMSPEMQAVERDRYITWLELRNQQTTVPGNVQPRLLCARCSILNLLQFKNCLVRALTAFVCL